MKNTVKYFDSYVIHTTDFPEKKSSPAMGLAGDAEEKLVVPPFGSPKAA